MKEKVYAAIDVGSNAVRLLIKKEDPDTDRPDLMLKKELLVRVPLRLGFDVFTKGEISEARADDLIRLMKAYKQFLKIYKVDRLRACATSAMRDASNGPEILKKIKKETDIDIDVIGGEEEARIVYNNHVERGGLSDGAYMFVDVGGGSTELNFMVDGRLLASRSFNIGTVRMLTGKVRKGEFDNLTEFLMPIADKYPEITIIGSGGNINKIYKLAKEKNSDDKSISVAELSRIYHVLKPLSVEQRIDRYAMRADRADVIIPAAEIFLHIASTLCVEKIVVPKIGVADGIIDGLYLADHPAN